MLEGRCLLSVVFTVTNVSDSGAGSLREAIIHANAKNPKASAIIDFKIPGNGLQTITPLTPLPAIKANEVAIEGNSQNIFEKQPISPPDIKLNGSALTAIPPDAVGLTLAGSGDAVSHLEIIGFSERASKTSPIYGDGVLIRSGSTDSVIDSVIAGNVNGIELDKPASRTTIAGDFIGTNAAGTAAQPNDIGIDVMGTSYNKFGLKGARNIISGNRAYGIAFFGGNFNTIQNNFIGTNAAGTAAIANGQGLIIKDGASANLVGNNAVIGFKSHLANVISGNVMAGVDIQANAARGNIIAGNLIGTDITGELAVGNGDGVACSGPDDSIGLPDDGNLISGNLSDGIALFDALSTTIQRNFIGTDLTGNAILPNGMNGISLTGGSSHSLIGSRAAGSVTSDTANVISGNDGSGIYFNNDEVGNSNNTIAGNLIGINLSGNQRLGNLNAGVYFNDNGTGNVIGLPGDGNVISGNHVGVLISGSSQDIVEGNFIGLDITGTFALANANGIEIEPGTVDDNSPSATGNSIGINAYGAKNFIAGNSNDGILLFGSTTMGNSIEFNVFGLNTSGHSVPNRFHEVAYAGGATP